MRSCGKLPSKIQWGGDEKLYLLHRSFNSGNPGIPSNNGLNVSRGEYILFIDNDDFITKTALEELYPIAKKFDADVVHCEKYFEFIDGQNSFKLESYQKGEFVKEPTLLTKDLAQRTVELNNKRFLFNLWTKLIRRDYLLFNDIKMISGMAQDALFTFCLLVSAKNYVRVPNVVNFYRVVEDSLSHKKQNIVSKIHQWFNAMVIGFQYFENFLSEREFFQKRPDAKYVALEAWVRECLNYLQETYKTIPAFQLDEIIRHEFSKVHDKTGLMAFLFSRMNVFNVNLNHQGAMIQQMNAYIQKANAHIQQQNNFIKQQQEQIKQLQAQLNSDRE